MSTLKLIRKKDEIHALNGLVVDSMDSNSIADAPSIRAVKETTNNLDVRITNIERNGVVATDTLPIGSEVLIDNDAIIPAGWEVIDEAPSISNPNLLINSDFRYPINQRGKTSYVNSLNWQWCYTVDRWAYSGSVNKSTVTVNNSSITITNTATDSSHFRQWFERLCDTGYYTITMKVISVSGIVKVHVDSGEKSDALVAGENVITLNATPEYFNILMDAGSSIELEYIKLEQGQAPTPFIPRLYGEELCLCRRYYRNNTVHLTSWEHTNTYAYFGYNYEPMRIAPTFSYIGFDETSNHQGGVTKSNAVQVLENTAVDRLTIRITFNDSNTAYYRHASGRIILDAEIY